MQENPAPDEATNTTKEETHEASNTTKEETYEATNTIKETPPLEATKSENTRENPSANLAAPQQSFAQRAKAGFPKRALPSEMARSWEKPTENLHALFPPVDLGPLGIVSRFLEIKNLPLTAIPRDIQMMAPDIPIVEIAPIRNSYFQLTGSYEMSFQNDKAALKFVNLSMQKYLGGNKLEFKFLPKSYEIRPRAPFNHLRDSGNSIVVCGLPKNISVDQIREMISDSPGNQQLLWKNIFELP
ncbi:17308_t:CDS:2, partial [Acaulospora colombiana]